MFLSLTYQIVNKFHSLFIEFNVKPFFSRWACRLLIGLDAGIGLIENNRF
jgi:hypothetical protein